MNDRDAVLSSLGEREIELKWDPGYLLAWSCGYYMLFMFLAVPLLLFLPIENKDSKIYAWILIPILPTILAAAITHKTQKDRAVVFNRHGFRSLNRDQVLTHILWNEISRISNHRKGIVVHFLNGSSQVVAFPQFKMNDDARQFLIVIKSFKSKGTDEVNIVKWLRVCIPLLIFGVVSAAVQGRPAILTPGYEGPIGAQQYETIALWIISTICWIAGAFGLTALLMVKIERWSNRPHLTRTSAFGPTVQEHIEASHNWPVPADLVEGVKYRYLDPEGVTTAIRERAAALWFTAAVIVFLFSIASPILYFLAPGPNHPQDGRLLAITVPISLIGGVAAFWYGKKISQWKVGVHDTISTSSDALIVTRDGQEIRYPKSPNKPMPTQFQKREARKPFGQTETYGTGQDVYIMDRRYLIPVE